MKSFTSSRRSLLLALVSWIAASHATADSARPATTIDAERGRREARIFVFEYEVTVPATPEVANPLHVFVPIPMESPAQEILRVQIRGDVEGAIGPTDAYGNRTWHAVLPAQRDRPLTQRFEYHVKRRVVRAGESVDAPNSIARFLGASRRVAVGHPILDPILAEIRQVSPGTDASIRARAIYDWVVDNVEYKKVGTGWGNGDTFWACNERSGNCTDFHSLFLSLARTEGIPARFEMGFPVPDDRPAGEIAGYHCWVEFWLPESGWVPIDASEASKHPDRRELFYGTHPADRIHFTTGRDLRLGPDHRGAPLNYFIYPYLESGGRPVDIEIETHFAYRPIGDATAAQHAPPPRSTHVEDRSPYPVPGDARRGLD